MIEVVVENDSPVAAEEALPSYEDLAREWEIRKSQERAIGAIVTPKPDVNWRYRAECQKVDPELFFPHGNGLAARVQIIRAKEVCKRCPVLVDCRAWTIETRQEYGVSGDLSEDERNALLGRRSTRR